MKKLFNILIVALTAVTCDAQSAFMVPQSTTLPLTTRQANVSNLVISLQWGTNAAAIPETYPIFTNFVMRARSQTISGANTLTGANILSNASQQFVGGTINGVLATNVSRLDATDAYIQTAYLYGPLRITNAFPYMTFFAVGGDTDEKMTVMRGYSDTFILALHNDDGTEGDIVYQVARNGSVATSIGFTPPIIPAGGIDGGGIYYITNIIVTNSIGGFTAIVLNGALTQTNGNASFANNAMTTTVIDTGGTTDDKIWKWIADGDTLDLKTYNDAGSLVETAISIGRVAGVIQEVSIPTGDLSVLDGMIVAENDIEAHSDGYFAGMIAAGTASPTFPASATGGFYAFDAIAPSADPLTGAFIWSEGGMPKYRTSTASEGSGGENRVHNRTATTSGAGTDYSFTTSTAAIDFGTTDPSVTIPTAGTYLFIADIRFTNGAIVNDEYRFKIRNTTAGADVVSDMIWTLPAASQVMSANLTGTLTCSASDVVTIYGFNNTGARGTCQSAGTRLRYVRLY